MKLERSQRSKHRLILHFGVLAHRPTTTHLILIELAVFVLLLALVLKGNDNETDEDVHHEERDYDDVDDVVSGHYRPKVMNWSVILFVRVDRPLQQSVDRQTKNNVNSLLHFTFIATYDV